MARSQARGMEVTHLGKMRPYGGPKRNVMIGRGEALDLEHFICAGL